MKRLYIIILLTLLFTYGCGGHRYSHNVKAISINESNTNKISTRVIAQADEWRNSGVIIQKGIEYKITAEGKWRSGGLGCAWNGPDGFKPNLIDFSLISAFYSTALIAKIGNNGEPFFVGSKLESTFDEEGILYFRINDLLGACWDNKGSVDVTISKMSSQQNVFANTNQSSNDSQNNEMSSQHAQMNQADGSTANRVSFTQVDLGNRVKSGMTFAEVNALVDLKELNITSTLKSYRLAGTDTVYFFGASTNKCTHKVVFYPARDWDIFYKIHSDWTRSVPFYKEKLKKGYRYYWKKGNIGLQLSKVNDDYIKVWQGSISEWNKLANMESTLSTFPTGKKVEQSKSLNKGIQRVDFGKGLLLGRITVKFEGYKGKYETHHSNLSVQVVGHNKEGDDVCRYEPDIDSNGYFMIPNVPLDLSYSMGKIKGNGYTIPKMNMSTPFFENKRITGLFAKSTIDQKGSISFNFKNSSNKGYKYFLNYKETGAWKKYIQEGLEKK